MPPRLCPRCHSVLHREDEGSLIYCWNCGAPQVRLSEELLDQLQHQQEAATTPPETPGASNLRPSDPGTPVWSGAIQTAALTGAVALALSLLTLLLPPVILLSLFWFIGAPIVALGLYHARFRQTLINPGFGARLGALCALAILGSTAVLNTVELLLARFVFHATRDLDQQITAAFTNAAARATATSGGDPLNLSAMLSIPEFRIGLILSGTATVFALYVAFSSVAGAFAGYLRRDNSKA